MVYSRYIDIKTLKLEADLLGYVVRKLDGEYQAKPKGTLWTDGTTIFTDDADDLLGTIKMDTNKRKVC